MNCRGFLLSELLISIGLFFFVLGGFLITYRFAEREKDAFILHLRTSRSSLQNIEAAYLMLKDDFYRRDMPNVDIHYENDASLMIASGRFKRRVSNPALALGQSTCVDSFTEEDIKDFKIQPIDISFGSGNSPTDIDIVGANAFIATDSATATDTDLFIYDISNQPILRGKLNTGPGLASLHVVGNSIFAANQSINGQLQVIDSTDLDDPHLMKTIKIPGSYSDNTAVGQKIIYDKDKLFLATKKSSIAELHFFDATDLKNPIWKGSYEMDSGPNALIASHTSTNDYLMVALPSDPELVSLDVTDLAHPRFVDSFDAPTGSGNGKSLGRYDNSLFMGRTVGISELFTFKIMDGKIEEQNLGSAGTSINGAIYKGRYIFSITSDLMDPFRVYVTDGQHLIRFSNAKFPISARVVAFDCDQKNFYLLTSDPAHPLYLISPA